MPRRQVQLPDALQASPQARPTDQFVQTKPNYDVPKHILDISRFSQTLTGLIAQSQIDAHERSMAQGEMDATFSRPFGAGAATTAEGEANRKAFKGAQESGAILPSEDPWYRIGVLTAEGRRAALNVHEHVNTADNINAASRVYDANGNFIPFEQREDPIAIFERQKMAFLNVPALQSIYGQRAAAEMLGRSRAQFVTHVSALRDKQTQEYHETQVVDQIVAQIGRVEQTSLDKSAEGKAYHSEAMAGLADLLNEQTVKWNLPDGPKVLRQAGIAAIEHAASDPKTGSPWHALAMIDLYRKAPLGTSGSTIGSDNSVDGLAFRMQLDQLEAHYNYAAGVEGERQEKNAELERKAYMRRVEEGISAGFSAGLPPSAAFDKMRRRIEAEVDPRFQSDALKNLQEQYTDRLKPRPRNAEADDQLQFRLRRDTVDSIDEWISSIQGSEVSWSQASEMRKTLQTEAESWKNLPEVKLASDAIDAETRVFTADRSEGVQDQLRDLTNDRVASANERIQMRSRGLNGQQRAEQMGGIVKEEYAKATQALDAFKSDISTRSVAFDIELRNANNKGVNFEEKIDAARQAGLLTRSEFRTAVESNQRASDISHYTEDSRVKNVLSSLFPTTEIASIKLAGKNADQVIAASNRAYEMAQEWATTERGQYESTRDADNGFTKFINTKLRPEMAKMLDLEGADKPLGATSKPGGPSFQQEDNATAGKAMQGALESGDQQVLKVMAAVSYADPLPRLKDRPQSIGKFKENFGQRNGLMPKIRAQARNEIATLSRFSVGDQAALKTALLNQGIATPRELLAGEMVVNGAAIQFTPKELDIWKTMVFTSTAQFENACLSDSRMVRSIGKLYGVTDEDSDVWIDQQKFLLKANGL